MQFIKKLNILNRSKSRGRKLNINFYYLGNLGINLFFKKAYPEPDFKYFLNFL